MFSLPSRWTAVSLHKRSIHMSSYFETPNFDQLFTVWFTCYLFMFFANFSIKLLGFFLMDLKIHLSISISLACHISCKYFPVFSAIWFCIWCIIYCSEILKLNTWICLLFFSIFSFVYLVHLPKSKIIAIY